MALTDNLVSYWGLKGDSTDITGARNGDTTSGVSYDASYGKVGGGARVGGGYIQSPRNTLTIGTLGDISLSAWVKTTDGTAEIFGFTAGTYADCACLLHTFNSGTKIRMMIQSSAGGGGYIDATGVDDGNWHFVVGTYGSGVAKIYVDGDLKDTNGSCTPNSAANSMLLAIGRVENYSGDISDCGYWNRVLTADEVEDLYNSGTGLAYPFVTATGAIKALVVAGGGAGGSKEGGASPGGGGGGGGGVVGTDYFPIVAGTYPIVIGAGGTPQTGLVGNNGGNSTFAGLTATGGGGGGALNGANGGCGGGAGDYGGSPGTGSQGYNGGTTAGVGNASSAAGGGGAGAVGGNPAGTFYGEGGNGGVGLYKTITGASVAYGGGGGGQNYYNGTNGLGGAGGGGNGCAPTVNANGENGTDGLGGGGGGAQASSGGGSPMGGSGGDGVVIIAYKTDGSDGVSALFSTGGTKTTSGDYTIHTFTTDGNFVVVTPVAYTLDATVAAFTLTGIDVGLLKAKAYELICQTTSYTLTMLSQIIRPRFWTNKARNILNTWTFKDKS